MGHCKDCKWWDHTQHSSFTLSDGECKRIGYVQEDDDATLACLDGYWEDWLYTKPDFGCVLFEAKE